MKAALLSDKFHRDPEVASSPAHSKGVVGSEACVCGLVFGRVWKFGQRLNISFRRAKP